MSAAPFAVREIDHVVLRVRDASIVERFYIDVVGCFVERKVADLGFTQLRAGRSLIDLVTVDGPLGRPGGAAAQAEGHNVDHVCLRVEPWNEKAIREHLASHAIAIDGAGERYGAEGNGPSLYVRDPEGNTVELKGPPTSIILEN